MTMTAFLELGGWGGVGEWGLALYPSPLGVPAQGTGPFSHMLHTDCICAGAEGCREPVTPTSSQGPSPAGDVAHVGRRASRQPPQGRVLASSVGSRMGGTSPVLSSREEGTGTGTCVRLYVF